jgi:hypothetical protein
MTIKVRIEPRGGDGLYEIHVGDAGDTFLVSHQGYENAADAETLVKRLFGKPVWQSSGGAEVPPTPEPVDLTVKYRTGKGKHEMIR